MRCTLFLEYKMKKHTLVIVPRFHNTGCYFDMLHYIFYNLNSDHTFANTTLCWMSVRKGKGSKFKECDLCFVVKIYSYIRNGLNKRPDTCTCTFTSAGTCNGNVFLVSNNYTVWYQQKSFLITYMPV